MVRVFVELLFTEGYWGYSIYNADADLSKKLESRMIKPPTRYKILIMGSETPEGKHFIDIWVKGASKYLYIQEYDRSSSGNQGINSINSPLVMMALEGVVGNYIKEYLPNYNPERD
jgi:hypothetical protein